MIAAEEIKHGGTDTVHKQSSHKPDGIKSEDFELQDRADQRTKAAGSTKIDEVTKRDESASASIYYHEGGGLIAKSVD